MTLTHKVTVALDFANLADAKTLVSQLNPEYCNLKVGKELFTTTGPAFIEYLHNKNFKVFLDLKFHDIPNTVSGACKAATQLGVWMLNVHASGGRAMMQAAREAVEGGARNRQMIATAPLFVEQVDDGLAGQSLDFREAAEGAAEGAAWPDRLTQGADGDSPVLAGAASARARLRVSGRASLSALVALVALVP